MILDEDRVPRNVIDRCAAYGEAMVDLLRERVNNDRAWLSDIAPGEWWLLLHTAMILGLIASESAGLLLVGLMRRMALAGDDNLQDWLAGYWPRLFANKPRSAIEAARVLCEDRALAWYIRSQGADVVIDAASRDAAEGLERDLDWLAARIADGSEDWDFRLSACSALLDFPRERHRNLLAHLAASQSEYMVQFSAEDIDIAYARGHDERNWERRGDPWQFYAPGKIARRQDRWEEEDAAGDEDLTHIEDDFFDEPALPYVRATEKVGRNDPCPCGSGKKYKKCCLPKEEA
ncbi:MAG: SEC-C metal-binding domain-containing protein [Betaproteobacteria bacterium]